MEMLLISKPTPPPLLSLRNEDFFNENTSLIFQVLQIVMKMVVYVLNLEVLNYYVLNLFSMYSITVLYILIDCFVLSEGG